MDWIAAYHRFLGLGNVLLLRRGTRFLLWTPRGIRLIVVLAQRETAELVSHFCWLPTPHHKGLQATGLTPPGQHDVVSARELLRVVDGPNRNPTATNRACCWGWRMSIPNRNNCQSRLIRLVHISPCKTDIHSQQYRLPPLYMWQIGQDRRVD